MAIPSVTKIVTTAAIMVALLAVLSRTAAGPKLGLSAPK